MNIYLPLVLLLFCFSVAASSQSMQKSLISAGGSGASCHTYTLTASLAQCLTGASSTTEAIAYQGFWFQQPTQSHQTETTFVQQGDILVQPHPIRDVSTIHYTPICSGRLRAAIYTLNGELVAELFDAPLDQSAAPKELLWRFDSRDIASGIYALRISTKCGQHNSLIILQH